MDRRGPIAKGGNEGCLDIYVGIGGWGKGREMDSAVTALVISIWWGRRCWIVIGNETELEEVNFYLSFLPFALPVACE
jgi:hypothetical protein